MAAESLSVIARFESKFIPEPNSGCWLWLGGKNRWGYGQFWLNGQTIQAHRVAYELWRGPIPDALLVMHRCDNRACVNPDHLKPGTYQENSADMVRKGRSMRGIPMPPAAVRRGEDNVTAKYTQAQVEEILRSELSHRAIAAKLGVGYHTVWKIRRGLQWRHVT